MGEVLRLHVRKGNLWEPRMLQMIQGSKGPPQAAKITREKEATSDIIRRREKKEACQAVARPGEEHFGNHPQARKALTEGIITQRTCRLM